VRTHTVAGRGEHADAVAPAKVRHGAGGGVANAPLESGEPRFVGSRVDIGGLDDERDMTLRFLRPFAQHELACECALAPVDVARVVAFAHRADAEDLVADAATESAMIAGAVAGLLG